MHRHPTKTHIAAEVRAAMARRGVSARRLAPKVNGISYTSFCERLTGKVAFNTDQLAVIADELHVPLMSFFASPDADERELAG